MAVLNDNVDGDGYGSPYVDSLIWGCKWDPDVGDPPGPLQIRYYLGSGTIPDTGGATGYSWDANEVAAIQAAFQLYENVANVDFIQVGTFGEADIAEWQVSNQFLGGSLGAHELPDPSTTPLLPPYGYYNAQDPSWANLNQGSFGFVTIIHELGHALGLAHPHDGGIRQDEPDASTFPGVSRGNSRDKGDFGLNQGIWTTMTYIDGWDKQPTTSEDFGYQGTPMAFDIAALQELYGKNMSYNTGNDTYELPTQNQSGTFWSCIWDAGGASDLIDGSAATGDSKINLNDATLAAGDPNAGGFVSWVQGIAGGFTIANGVTIENATGGSGNDTLTGNEVVNILIGNGGNDSIDGGGEADDMRGGAGDDTYVVDDKDDTITEESGTDTVHSFLDFVLADVLEHLTLVGTEDIDGTGNAGNNLLIGNVGANVLDGATGIDTMQGGAGDDTYGVDALGDVVTEDSKAGTDTVRSKISYTLGATLENLVLLAAAAAITATGNALANELTGNDEANTLDGKAGSDIMTGGKGDDLYIMDNAGDQVIETGGDTDDAVQSSVAFKDGFAGIEDYVFTGKSKVFFTAADEDVDNAITTAAAADTIDGGKGNDSMAGGAGNDTYFADSSDDKVTEADKGGTDTVKSSASFVLDGFVEKLELTGDADIDGTGNALANTITGNSKANELSGLGGNDTLTGGDGNDTLDGGADKDAMTGGNGNDLYVVSVTGDKVTESAAAGGDDTVESAITYVLGKYVEDLTLTEGNTNGTGNTDDNLIVGSDGDNVLDGKAGADILRGGKGNDTYVVDGLDTVDEAGGDGEDTLKIAATFVLGAIAGIENLTLMGTGAFKGTGAEDANVIIGNSGANTLDGQGGDDSLAGGSGNDSLLGANGNDTVDGGAGVDNLTGGTGNDTYGVDSAKDVVNETGDDSDDRIVASITIDLVNYDKIEHVALTGMSALKATGDELGNELTGNDGANLLAGLAGGDTLVGNKGNDTLDGGLGADDLAGGAGNDTYIVDNAGDSVDEALDEGTDTVRTSLSGHILEDNVENLVLLADAGAASGTGNALKNTLTGNDLANTLNGGGEADTLIGGKGNDTYNVDDAKDVVKETSGMDSGVDTVISTAATYTIGSYVENLTLGGAGNVNGVGNTLNNILTGNDGANTLNGGGGNDTVTGGEGNDTITVATGNDLVRYTDVLDGLDSITSFDANATGGQDVFDLDALFDSLGVATADRAGHVTIGAPAGNSVEVQVDGTAIATLTLTNAADAVTVGADVIVGTL